MPSSRNVLSYRNLSLTNTLIGVKEGASRIYGWIVNNENASEVFVQFHDAATTGDVTLGSDTPDLAVKVANDGTDKMMPSSKDAYVDFDNGLVIAATTEEANSTAPATAVSVTIFYK